MNTNQIRKFATEARTRLLKGVSNQLKAFFDEKGNPHIVPTQVQGGCIYGETLRDEAFFRAWKSLNKHIDLYGFETSALTSISRKKNCHGRKFTCVMLKSIG